MGLIRRLVCQHEVQYTRSWVFRSWMGVMLQCMECQRELRWYRYDLLGWIIPDA